MTANTCTSCKAAPANPGTALCRRCHANSDMLRVIMPALLKYSQNHPDPDAIGMEMLDLVKALSKMGLVDTEGMQNNGAAPDDSYPVEWLLNAPAPDDELELEDHSMNPAHPSFLNGWRPNPGERAIVDDIALQYVVATTDFNRMFLAFSRDCYKDRSWPQAFLALLEAFKNTAIGSQGLELTIARLRSDLEHARAEALEEAQ